MRIKIAIITKCHSCYYGINMYVLGEALIQY